MTETANTKTVDEVAKSVLIEQPVDFCFEQFVRHSLEWWPPTHKLVAGQRTALNFEETVGGAYYEVDEEGNRAEWGRILEWEPGRRIRMSWAIDGTWQPISEDERASRILVTFEPQSQVTKVTLVHLELERHGDDAVKIFNALNGPSPGETLQRFADHCENGA